MVLPVAGSFHGLVPLASPTKLATALGAWAGKSVHFKSPAEVWMMAVGEALDGAALLAVLEAAAEAGAFGLVCAPAARPKHSRINAARVTIRLSFYERNRILEMERQQYVKALRRKTAARQPLAPSGVRQAHQ